jgi:hypothetical protein
MEIYAEKYADCIEYIEASDMSGIIERYNRIIDNRIMISLNAKGVTDFFQNYGKIFLILKYCKLQFIRSIFA